MFLSGEGRFPLIACPSQSSVSVGRSRDEAEYASLSSETVWDAVQRGVVLVYRGHS